MSSVPIEYASDSAQPRAEARFWMAVTLIGVLLACLAALILLPVRQLVSEE